MTNSTHTVEETVAVIQADRDAAADNYLARRFGDGDEDKVAALIRTGECDHWWHVQDIARRRLASHSTPAEVTSVACPRCHATPGAPCLGVLRSHRARYDAALSRPPSTHDELVEALREAHTVIAVSIAFLGRDRGTDRQEKMLDGLTDELVAADKMIRAALTKMGEKL